VAAAELEAAAAAAEPDQRPDLGVQGEGSAAPISRAGFRRLDRQGAGGAAGADVERPMK